MESFIQLTVFTQTLHVWSVFAGWLLWWHMQAQKHNIARKTASSEGLRIVKARSVWCQLSIRFSTFNLHVLQFYPNKSYTQRFSEMLFVPQSVHVRVYTAKPASCIIPFHMWFTSLLFACLSRNVVKGLASSTIVLIDHVIWFLQMLKSIVEKNLGLSGVSGNSMEKGLLKEKLIGSDIRLVLRHGLWNHLEH